MTVFVLLMIVASSVYAAEKLAAPAKVLIDSTSVAAGIGMSWGDGKLVFSGKRYYFSVDGLSFIDFGLARSSAAGDVYNLTDLAKFEGTYVAAEGGLALGGGLGGTALRNQHGVLMYLHSVSQGIRLQMGASGITIKFRDQRYSSPQASSP